MAHEGESPVSLIGDMFVFTSKGVLTFLDKNKFSAGIWATFVFMAAYAFTSNL